MFENRFKTLSMGIFHAFGSENIARHIGIPRSLDKEFVYATR